MSQNSEHWNQIYNSTNDEELGWYEKNSAQTLKFLNKIQNLDNATVFLPGAGISTLIEELKPICRQLILNDISDSALEKLQYRYGDDEQILYLNHDVSQKFPRTMPQIDLWLDRAVLHFLLSEEQIMGYFENLKDLVKKSAHVLLAEFAEDGAQKCAGLLVHRYSIDKMSQRLGSDFELVAHERNLFENPFGDTRPYNYALFRRIK